MAVVGIDAFDLEVASLFAQDILEFSYVVDTDVADLGDDEARAHIGLIIQDTVVNIVDYDTAIDTQFGCVILAEIGKFGAERFDGCGFRAGECA